MKVDFPVQLVSLLVTSYSYVYYITCWQLLL